LHFISSFSFVDRDSQQSEAALTSVLLVARVIPVFCAMFLCLAAVPLRHYGLLFRELLRSPLVWWLWYAVVATTSGFANGIEPIWSAWKCTEIVGVLIWAAAVSVHLTLTNDKQLLEKCYQALFYSSYAVCAWAMLTVVQGDLGWRAYLYESRRLNMDWPHINSITLGTLAMFCMLGCFIRVKPGQLRLAIIMAVLPSLVFVMARSRTPLLGLCLLGVIAILSTNMSRSYKLVFPCLLFAIAVGALVSPDFRTRLRIESPQEIQSGSGRIRTKSGAESAWAESIRAIEKQPLIGYGYLNAKRFIKDKDRSVDNGALQALLSAGFIGATPLIIYVPILGWMWLLGTRTRRELSQQTRRLAAFGLIAYSLAVAKSMTTNSLSGSGFPLLLLLLSSYSLRITRVESQMHPSIPSTADIPV